MCPTTKKYFFHSVIIFLYILIINSQSYTPDAIENTNGDKVPKFQNCTTDEYNLSENDKSLLDIIISHTDIGVTENKFSSIAVA